MNQILFFNLMKASVSFTFIVFKYNHVFRWYQIVCWPFNWNSPRTDGNQSAKAGQEPVSSRWKENGGDAGSKTKVCLICDGWCTASGAKQQKTFDPARRRIARTVRILCSDRIKKEKGLEWRLALQWQKRSWFRPTRMVVIYNELHGEESGLK